jgi:adenylate cyclase
MNTTHQITSDLARAGRHEQAAAAHPAQGPLADQSFDAVGGHGGVVNPIIGDGAMAIFGAPLPLDDACGSAVAAALEMVELVSLFSAEREAAGKPAIRIGLGIATGPVIAGYTGTDKRATYTCVGSTVNLAARLEAHTKAARRTVLIDEATRAALGAGTEVEPLGEVALKGMAQGFNVFAVGA